MASPASRSAHSRSSAGPSGLPDARVVSVEDEAHPVPQDHGHHQRLPWAAAAEQRQQPLVRGRGGTAPPPRLPLLDGLGDDRRLGRGAAARCGRGRQARASPRGPPARRRAPRRRGAAGAGRGRPPRRPVAASPRVTSPRRHGASGAEAMARGVEASRGRLRLRPCGSSPRGGSGRWPLPPRPRAPRPRPRCRRPRPRGRPRSGSSRCASGTAPARRAPSAAAGPPPAGPRLSAPVSTRTSPSLRPSAERCCRSSAAASAAAETSPRQTRMLPNVSRIELDAA